MKTIIFDLDGTLIDLASPRRIAKQLYGASPKCFADIRQLKNLCQKYRFALVTGASRTETLGALRRFGLDNFFQAEFIITKDEVSALKATGAPFRKIKKIIDGPAIFIGDSQGDLLGSNKAGLSYILVKKGQDIKQQKINFKMALSRAIDRLDEF